MISATHARQDNVRSGANPGDCAFVGDGEGITVGVGVSFILIISFEVTLESRSGAGVTVIVA
jgi:hypothetical protein